MRKAPESSDPAERHDVFDRFTGISDPLGPAQGERRLRVGLQLEQFRRDAAGKHAESVPAGGMESQIRQTRQDSGQIPEFGMGQVNRIPPEDQIDSGADADLYKDISEESLIQIGTGLFQYCLHDDYLARFRKMLTLEQIGRAHV